MQVSVDYREGFNLFIDFAASEGDASRVFRSMATLIDAFAALDQDLVGIVGEELGTELVLDEVTTGSLRSHLRSLLLSIPDGPLSELDAKKLIGHYLVKAKYLIVEWLGRNDKIESITQVRVLEHGLLELAEETGVRRIPAYRPVSTRHLLSRINGIQIGVAALDEKDLVRYESPVGSVEIPRTLRVSEELIRQMLTREVITSEDVRIVKVKKPDYLGASKWVLKYAGHSIEASIADVVWLARFQNNEISLQPGDSLRVLMREEVSYGHSSEVVHVSHAVLQVIEVIPPTQHQQGSFNV